MEEFVLSIERFETVLKCALCKQTFLLPFTLGECGHHFCEGCIFPYLGTYCACPQCQIPAVLGNLIKNNVLSNIVINLAKLKDWTPLGSMMGFPLEAFNKVLSIGKISQPSPTSIPETPPNNRDESTSTTSLEKATPVLIKKIPKTLINQTITPIKLINKSAPVNNKSTSSDTISSSVKSFKKQKIDVPNGIPKVVVTRATRPNNELNPILAPSPLVSKLAETNSLKRKRSEITSMKPQPSVKMVGSKVNSLAKLQSRPRPITPVPTFDSRKKWSCPKCTLLNLTRSKKCTMCSCIRPPLKTVLSSELNYSTSSQPLYDSEASVPKDNINQLISPIAKDLPKFNQNSSLSDKTDNTKSTRSLGSSELKATPLKSLPSSNQTVVSNRLSNYLKSTHPQLKDTSTNKLIPRAKEFSGLRFSITSPIKASHKVSAVISSPKIKFPVVGPVADSVFKQAQLNSNDRLAPSVLNRPKFGTNSPISSNLSSYLDKNVSPHSSKSKLPTFTYSKRLIKSTPTKQPAPLNPTEHTTNPVRVKKDEVLVTFTGFHPQQKKELVALLKNLNQARMKIKETDIKQATHLISSLAPNSTPKLKIGQRTVKYLLGLINNIPIVDSTWLNDSLQKKEWLPESSYFMRGTSVYGPLQVTVSPLKKPDFMTQLFKGYVFYLKGFSVKSAPTKSELMGLIISAGGKVVSDLMLNNADPQPDIGVSDSQIPHFNIHKSFYGRQYLLLASLPSSHLISNDSSGDDEPVRNEPLKLGSDHKFTHGLCSPARNSIASSILKPNFSMHGKEKQVSWNDQATVTLPTTQLQPTLPFRLRFPPRGAPLTIILESSTAASQGQFDPSMINSLDQPVPHYWILDCLSGRSLLPVPTPFKG